MKVHLLYRNRDYDDQRNLLMNEHDLIRDLELTTLFTVMSNGDGFLLDAVKKIVLSSLTEPEAIQYRQEILKDCIGNPSIVRGIYELTIETMENRRKHYYGIFTTSPSATLFSAVELLQMLMAMLKKLRDVAALNADRFSSEGFSALFAMLRKELDDEYFARIQNHLKELRFSHGVLISAGLESGNKGSGYMLSKKRTVPKTVLDRLFARKQPSFTFYVGDRDESGHKALSDIEGMGLNPAANALAQSADHILSFFNMLRFELAFYLGCMNLYDRLLHIGLPVSYPRVATSSERKHSFTGLYDVSLALTIQRKAVGNDVDADGKELFIVTGANQGGKSTFLRSVGLAQMMAQCGLFVPAESFCSNACTGIFTHYKREEDKAMKSGKFDEELVRMSRIVDSLAPDSMILFNESFAATNDLEGSEIAGQIISALLEHHIKIVYVTHLYELAHGFYEKNMPNAAFLRAERKADGGRTYRIVEGEPLETSYGEDLYNRIFGEA